MTGGALLSALAAAAALALVVPSSRVKGTVGGAVGGVGGGVRAGPTAGAAASAAVSAPSGETGTDADSRRRWLWALLAGLGAAVFVRGPAAPVVGVLVAGGVQLVLARSEPPAQRRAREAARRDLACLVDLFAAALSAGTPAAEAVGFVCAALPGPAADRLHTVRARLDVGLDPEAVWEGLAGDPVLGPLGRTLARAHATGAPVVGAVERLADDLAVRARADVEDRARAVGVKAAVPLGLCLLPAFLLLGIVPLVAGLLSGIAP
ncbi:type II secretion system F family protein [Nocardioides pacificus]